MRRVTRFHKDANHEDPEPEDRDVAADEVRKQDGPAGLSQKQGEARRRHDQPGEVQNTGPVDDGLPAARPDDGIPSPVEVQGQEPVLDEIVVQGRPHRASGAYLGVYPNYRGNPTRHRFFCTAVAPGREAVPVASRSFVPRRRCAGLRNEEYMKFDLSRLTHRENRI